MILLATTSRRLLLLFIIIPAVCRRVLVPLFHGDPNRLLRTVSGLRTRRYSLEPTTTWKRQLALTF